MNEWLKRVNFQNSDLNLHISIEVDREQLIRLKDSLSDFFGLGYFEIDARELKIVTLKAKHSDWVFQLLANDDYSSLVQVFELEHLLNHTSQNYPDLAKLPVRVFQLPNPIRSFLQ